MTCSDLPLTPCACPNRLLRGLSVETWQRLRPHMEWVELPLGTVLHEPDGPLSHGYFPTTATMSLLTVLADGASCEIAVVGFEGMVGAPVFLGGDTTPCRTVVQGKGGALRLPAPALRQEFDRGGPLMQLLLRHAQALITQMAQTAVCNRHHSLEQQLCRRLLLGLDRQPGNELAMTQEQIAHLLGVRREGVTEAAGRLQRAELIHYSRGHICVIDRAGLEAHVCECYGIVRRETERLLSGAGAL